MIETLKFTSVTLSLISKLEFYYLTKQKNKNYKEWEKALKKPGSKSLGVF